MRLDFKWKYLLCFIIVDTAFLLGGADLLMGHFVKRLGKVEQDYIGLTSFFGVCVTSRDMTVLAG